MEDFDSRFKKIMRENDMTSDFEPLSLTQIIMYMASVSTTLMHISHILLGNFDVDSEDKLNVSMETAIMLREVHELSERFLDRLAEDLLEDEDEDYDE